MPKSMKINNKKMTTFPRAGREMIRDETYLLILGIFLIDRNGLSTLTVLRALRLGRPGITSKIPVITTRKSMTFQPSLR